MKYTLARAERRALRVLNSQLDDLVKFPSTPHTTENQMRVLSTLRILTKIHKLEEPNGNSQDQAADS